MLPQAQDPASVSVAIDLVSDIVDVCRSLPRPVLYVDW